MESKHQMVEVNVSKQPLASLKSMATTIFGIKEEIDHLQLDLPVGRVNLESDEDVIQLKNNDKIKIILKTSNKPFLSTDIISLKSSEVILKERIGRGSFSEVHLGIWKSTDVAVKEFFITDLQE